MIAWRLGDVARLAGVQHRTLANWIYAGIVGASVAPPRGRRYQTLLGLDDVLQAMAVAELRRAGVSFQKVRRIVAFLREQGLELSDLELVEVIGDELVAYQTRTEAMAVLEQPGQHLLLPMAFWKKQAEKVAEEFELEATVAA